MPLPNIFDAGITQQIMQRIEQLTPQTPSKWGKMNVSQMLAHCNVTYEMIFEEGKHPKPGGLMRLMLKWFVKNKVVNEVAYKPNNPTGPQFIIKTEKNFEEEKKRLVDYLQQTQKLGAEYFNGRESNSFGILNTTQWNNMMFKHLDHHLNQFGV